MNDKYLQYNLEDFLNDDSFIAYVRNDNSANSEFWVNLFALHPELKKVGEEAKLLIKSINFKKDEISEQKSNLIWNNISLTIEGKEKSSKPLTKRLYTISFGVAASIILILFVMGVFESAEVLNKTSYAEINSVTLPDNSKVMLNIDSKLTYDLDKWKKERVVKLNGEAFFNVEKGEKFSVETDKVVVEVLGTSFNVYDRNNLLNVRCETGMVRVINKILSDTIVLNPGFGVIYRLDESFEKYSFDTDIKSIWKDGVITFNNNDLKFVFDEISRQYDINIDASESVLKRLFTGRIDLGNKEKTLESICWPMHLKFEFTGSKVRIIE